MAIQIQDTRTQEQQAAGAEKLQVMRGLAEVEEALTDLTTNWDGLTQANKLLAVRRGLIIALRAVRWLGKQAI